MDGEPVSRSGGDLGLMLNNDDSRQAAKSARKTAHHENTKARTGAGAGCIRHVARQRTQRRYRNRRYEWRDGEWRKAVNTRFVLCVDNSEYSLDLTLHKIYRVLPDDMGEQAGMIRIVDDTGEDYLYEANRFAAIELSAEAARATATT